MRPDREILIGLATLLAVVAVTTAGFAGALNGIFGAERTHVVRAEFRDAQQLKPGHDVRIQGIEAGTVKSVTLEGSGSSATAAVRMEVKNSAGPLYGDARAVLRWKTVLGGTFYVDLERGSPSRGTLRGAIPAARTARQVEVEDIVNTVKGGARRGLQALPNELAETLRDPRNPADLLDTVARNAPDMEHGVGALRGEDLDRDLRGLVADTAKTVAGLNAPNGQLRRLVEGAARTLQTTAARNLELRQTLRQAPATTTEAVGTLTRLRSTLELANPLLAKLRGPAGMVAPAFADLRPAVISADRLVRRAEPLLDQLRPATDSLAGTARRALPLVNELIPSLDRLDNTILPYLSAKDPGTTKSTAVMIGGTFTGLASGAGGQMDANGHFIRFPATFGSAPLNSLPCQTYINNPDAAEVVACNDLQKAFSAYFGYRPLGSTPGTEPPPTSTSSGGR